MDKDEEVEPQQSSKAMDPQQQQQQQQVDDDDENDENDPYGFLVEQCIIPSAEENHLRSMPLFSPPTPIPIPTQQQQPSLSPPPVVKHEQTDEIDITMQQPALEMEEEKEKEATENMEVDEEEEEEESQSVTKEPIISVENSPPIENEGFSQQTRDEHVVDDETPSPDTGEELQKTIEEESPLEQNEGLVAAVQPQSPPTTKTQTGQTHFVPPRVQPATATTAAATATATAVGVGVGVGVGPSSSSSSNPQNPKEGDNTTTTTTTTTTIDILDVLRSKGFYVPRPRWWRPEGYDKP